MTDRFPLIVNASANQIQELPSSDSLQLGDTNKIKLGTDDDLLLFHDGTSGSINLANGSLTTRVHDSNGKGFYIEDPNGGSAETIAKFEKDATSGAGRCELMHGGLKKFETTSSGVTVTGELTVSAQPSCLLTVPEIYTANNSSNGKPITFTTVTRNVGCTVTRATPATALTTGKTTITVPSTGTYLVTAGISAQSNGGAGGPTDKIVFSLDKGSGFFPSEFTFPTFNFGVNESESNCTFSLPLALSAGDALFVKLTDIGTTANADVFAGYFSVTKLY